METAMERLYERQALRIGTTVTLRRGSFTTTLVPTVLGNQLLKITDEDGTTQTVRTDKDFFIRATEYLIDDVAVEPERGDRISETIDGVTAVYEVLPYGDEKEFRWSDEWRKVYRIHTKLMEIE